MEASIIQIIVLTLASLVTGTFAGILGMGGGILLLAVMSQYYPHAVLIPLHGLIQLASNVSRAGFNFASIDRKLLGQFALGSVAGAFVASRFNIEVAQDTYQLALGIFILAATFIPAPPILNHFAGKWLAVGSSATFLGIWFGATGPLIAPFYLQEGLKRQALVATKAACQTFLHLGKLAVFFAMGFSLTAYWSILLPMLTMVVLGSFLGARILDHVPERLFLLLFKCLIVILAGRMILQGLRLSF